MPGNASSSTSIFGFLAKTESSLSKTSASTQISLSRAILTTASPSLTYSPSFFKISVTVPDCLLKMAIVGLIFPVEAICLIWFLLIPHNSILRSSEEMARLISTETASKAFCCFKLIRYSCCVDCNSSLYNSYNFCPAAICSPGLRTNILSIRPATRALTTSCA
ncbi:hypothetical protein D3C80_1335070 [compost metagenome]